MAHLRKCGKRNRKYNKANRRGQKKNQRRKTLKTTTINDEIEI